eukprot:501413-Lingulodinium_polyedra.AAC.1
MSSRGAWATRGWPCGPVWRPATLELCCRASFSWCCGAGSSSTRGTPRCATVCPEKGPRV